MRELFPPIYANAIEQLEKRNDWNEVFICIGQPVIFFVAGKEQVLSKEGTLICVGMDEPYLTTKDDLQYIMQHATNATPMVYRTEIGQGYLTIAGGHRLGFAGDVCVEKENGREYTFFKNINGMMLRIARERRGCAKQVLPFLLEKNSICNTLIISPPGCGKTTLLRDLARQVSEGCNGMKAKKVVVVDERKEIAANWEGKAQFDVGKKTNVLSGCKKENGFVMAVRSLSPEVLIADEIGFQEESRALLYGIYSGCDVICTTHGRTLEEVHARNGLRPLFAEGIFKRYIILSRREGVFEAQVYDERGEKLFG